MNAFIPSRQSLQLSGQNHAARPLCFGAYLFFSQLLEEAAAVSADLTEPKRRPERLAAVQQRLLALLNRHLSPPVETLDSAACIELLNRLAGIPASGAAAATPAGRSFDPERFLIELLRCYPGYTVRTLLAEPAAAVFALYRHRQCRER